MPPADATGAASLGITGGIAALAPIVKLPIDAPRNILIDTVNKLIDDLNTRLERAYPIGTLYFNGSKNTDPRQLLGIGTWERFGKGRTIVSLDEAQTEFDVLGETGGAKTHTLTIAEMPSHTHGQKVTANSGAAIRKDFVADAPAGEYDQGVQTYATGGGGAHNNLQPYIVVYVWRRIG